VRWQAQAYLTLPLDHLQGDLLEKPRIRWLSDLCAEICYWCMIGNKVVPPARGGLTIKRRKKPYPAAAFAVRSRPVFPFGGKSFVFV
jgi:hypothetical protein